MSHLIFLSNQQAQSHCFFLACTEILFLCLQRISRAFQAAVFLVCVPPGLWLLLCRQALCNQECCKCLSQGSPFCPLFHIPTGFSRATSSLGLSSHPTEVMLLQEGPYPASKPSPGTPRAASTGQENPPSCNTAGSSALLKAGFISSKAEALLEAERCS